MRVRRARRHEAPEIVALLHEVFEEFKPHFDPEGIAASSHAISRLGERWKDGPVWVAVKDRVIIGTVTTVPRDGSVYVRSMGVLPSERGRGVGRRLLEQAESYAAKKGIFRLYLSTTPYFAQAVSLYEKAGYRQFGEAKELHGLPLFTMEKTLRSDDSADGD